MPIVQYEYYSFKLIECYFTILLGITFHQFPFLFKIRQGVPSALRNKIPNFRTKLKFLTFKSHEVRSSFNEICHCFMN